jgi:dolichol-phosphate mannosyltransferase
MNRPVPLNPSAMAASDAGSGVGSLRPRVVVVVPTYNELANLPRLVPEILNHGPNYHLLIVDDSSPDGTGQLADHLATRHPGQVSVVHRPAKRGIGPAYVAGFAAALDCDPDLIVQMDADFSHDPADLPRLVAAASEHDLVLGSRYVEGGGTTGWPFARRLLSQLGGVYARLILGVPIADLTGGFKVWRRPLLASLDLEHVQADGYGFQIETTYRALQQGARVTELPIIFADRVAGASKLSRRIVLEAAIVVWQLRFEHSRRARTAANQSSPTRPKR